MRCAILMEIAPCASDVSFPYLNSTLQVSHACRLSDVCLLIKKVTLTFYSVLKVYARGQNVSWWMINLTFWTFA